MEHKEITNNGKGTNSSGSIYYIHDNKNIEEEDVLVGVPVHSQIIKIKQEFAKIKDPSLQQLEPRRITCKIARQCKRSLLGLADGPISVCNPATPLL